LLTTITTKIEITRDNEGKVPYGTVAKLVAHYQIFLPWLTRDHVNNHLRKLNKLGSNINQEGSPSDASGVSFPSSLSTVTTAFAFDSSLPSASTIPTPTHPYTEEGIVKEALVSEQRAATIPMESTETESETLLTCSNLGRANTNESTAQSSGGRPKGTTIAASQDLKNRLAMACQQATVDYTLEYCP
jgi:hypothetical protein